MCSLVSNVVYERSCGHSRVACSPDACGLHGAGEEGHGVSIARGGQATAHSPLWTPCLVSAPPPSQIMAAMAAFGAKPRAQWVTDWPAMVVLAASQVFWAAGVERAVAEGSVQAYLEQCTGDLLALTDLVRAIPGPLQARRPVRVAFTPAGRPCGTWQHLATLGKRVSGAAVPAVKCLPPPLPGPRPLRGPGARRAGRRRAPDAGRAHHAGCARARRRAGACRRRWVPLGSAGALAGRQHLAPVGFLTLRASGRLTALPVLVLPLCQASRACPTLSGSRGCATTGGTTTCTWTWRRRGGRGSGAGACASQAAGLQSP